MYHQIEPEMVHVHGIVHVHQFEAKFVFQEFPVEK